MKEEEKKDSFVFYRSFYESIKNLDKDTQIELFISICEYSLNEQEPTDLSPIANAMFTVIKPIIDSANTRYKTSIENGKKGGRPKKEKNLKKPNQNLNVNVNDNFNVNVNVNDNDKNNIYKGVVDYLNQKTGKNYKYTTTATKTKIKARLNEGYNLDDFKKVIDVKVREWTNTEYAKFLRPETLFGTKFESYLNQSEKVNQNQEDVGYNHMYYLKHWKTGEIIGLDTLEDFYKKFNEGCWEEYHGDR